MIQMESEPQTVKDILDQGIVSIDMRRFENVNLFFLQMEKSQILFLLNDLPKAGYM